MVSSSVSSPDNISRGMQKRHGEALEGNRQKKHRIKDEGTQSVKSTQSVKRSRETTVARDNRVQKRAREVTSSTSLPPSSLRERRITCKRARENEAPSSAAQSGVVQAPSGTRPTRFRETPLSLDERIEYVTSRIQNQNLEGMAIIELMDQMNINTGDGSGSRTQ